MLQKAKNYEKLLLVVTEKLATSPDWSPLKVARYELVSTGSRPRTLIWSYPKADEPKTGKKDLKAFGKNMFIFMHQFHLESDPKPKSWAT